MGRGFGIASAVDHEVVSDIAGDAERLGYTSFWVNDTPGADGLASLAIASAATDRISLGIGVVPLDRRPPATIAEQVAAYGIPVDRLLLGVGAGDAAGALARVRAGARDLARLVGARIVVGALGPRMAALAGETADAVLFNWLTPEHAERTGRVVHDTAARAGRARPSLIAYVRCALVPAAEERLRREHALYAGIPQFERHLERMGVGAYDTCVLGTDRAQLQTGIARYETVLDETVVRAITPDDSLDCLRTLLHACAPERADAAR